jgi:hypothetical protein
LLNNPEIYSSFSRDFDVIFAVCRVIDSRPRCYKTLCPQMFWMIQMKLPAESKDIFIANFAMRKVLIVPLASWVRRAYWCYILSGSLQKFDCFYVSFAVGVPIQMADGNKEPTWASPNIVSLPAICL